MHHIVGELFVQTDPVRATVNADASRQGPLAQPPHVILALVESLVQPLLLDELGLIAPVTLHKVALSVVGKKLNQFILSL